MTIGTLTVGTLVVIIGVILLLTLAYFVGRFVFFTMRGVFRWARRQ